MLYIVLIDIIARGKLFIPFGDVRITKSLAFYVSLLQGKHFSGLVKSRLKCLLNFTDNYIDPTGAEIFKFSTLLFSEYI